MPKGFILMKLLRCTLITLIFIPVLIITQTGCSRELKPVSVSNYYLDTTCNISVYELKDKKGKIVPAITNEDEANKAIKSAYGICRNLEKKLSRTIESSEIYALNHADGKWVEVSNETVEVVKKGIYYSELSGGDFDITIGGITKLWDFHAEKPVLPEDKEIKQYINHVNYNNIEINDNMLRIAGSKTYIDLGGIAKGYIGDRMADELKSKGVTSAIINLGGNVICVGKRPDGNDFRIGIETPFSDRSEVIGTVGASNKTVVTSGVYERTITVDGKKYHHVLSTKTGYPVDTDLNAVTLTADIGHSVDIDALSTICLIKGSKEGMKFIEGIDGIEACFVLADGTNKLTSGMKLMQN